jgi:hypothetical protein
MQALGDDYGCVTLLLDQRRPTLHLLVTRGAAVPKARALARRSVSASAAVHVGRVSARLAEPIVRRIAESLQSDPARPQGATVTRPANETIDRTSPIARGTTCSGVDIAIHQSSQNYEQQREWAIGQQQLIGADRIKIVDMPPDPTPVATP